MRNSACDLRQRRLVRRRNKTKDVGRDMCRERQIRIERRVDTVESDGSNQFRVVTEGIGEASREVEAADTFSGDVHDSGPDLAANQRQERIRQVVDVGR